MEKILVVDDEVFMRELLYNLLTRQGYQVVTSGNGVDALERLRSDRPDLIILDYKMTKMSGLETLRKIREFDTTVDIIMLTGFATAELEKEAVTLGVSNFIQKNLSIEVFVKTIKNSIEKRKTKVEEVRKQPAKIMVVDDDDSVRNLLARFLSRRGYTISVVASGEEALEKIKTDKPDLILLDIRMPGMDGLVTLKKIKLLDENIGVIMITADQDLDSAQAALALGAYEYIMKPFNLEYLDLAVLTKILMLK
ncbi:MAG: response regulator [Planctomycetes bacterium]|nr:response regulator [Planctomycetota bacterium]